MEIITQITFSNPSLFHPFYRVIAHFVVVDLVRLPWVIFLSHARRLRDRHRDRLIGRFGDPAPRAV